jgi:hypothetical protein
MVAVAYDEFDAVRVENIHALVTGLLAEEPAPEDDVILGIRATSLLKDKLTAYLLDSWNNGNSALRPAENASAR